MARKSAEDSGVMGHDAERVSARMERLGITDVELAREAKMDRGTIAAIKRGQGFRRSSLAKLERTLDALEHETGLDPLPEQAAEQMVEVEVRIAGQPDATVILRGPDAEERAARLLRRIQSKE